MKKIWIIGASTGIGAALAQKLADMGKEVVISARSADKLAAVAQHSDHITTVPLDVTDRNAVTQAMDKVGDFDSVIQCAGWYKPDTIHDFDAEIFQKHFDINVQGTANILDPVLKYFNGTRGGRGHIAIVSSVAGYHGLPRSLSYGPSKAALINMTEALAIECAETDIKVQLINPGFVETPLTAQNDFDMPMIISADKAADHIIKGMQRGYFEITFPWLFSRILRRIAALPYALSIPLINKVTKK